MTYPLRSAAMLTTSAQAVTSKDRQFVSNVKAAQLEVFRVTVTAAELERAGMAETPDDMVFENVLRPLLIKKGVPDRYLYEAAPFKADQAPNGDLILEFD